MASREVLLAHGASGSAATMVPWVEALRDRGFRAETVPGEGKLPMRADRAVEVYRGQLQGRHAAVIGGVSYGGRVASMLAAEASVGGLVLLSYPLHPPGKPDQLRTAHLAGIGCPALFLSGGADPFAQPALLQAAVGLVQRAELVLYPRVGHGLSRDPAVMQDCVERIAGFLRGLG